jgi:phage shock protein E
MFNFMSKTSDIDISAEEFKEKLKSNPGKIIDVRTRVEYEEGHLTITDEQYDWNSGEFHKVVDQMEKDKAYYLYCRSGNRSGQAARLMRNKGFENVYNVGGFEDLADFGFEAERE